MAPFVVPHNAHWHDRRHVSGKWPSPAKNAQICDVSAPTGAVSHFYILFSRNDCLGLTFEQLFNRLFAPSGTL